MNYTEFLAKVKEFLSESDTHEQVFKKILSLRTLVDVEVRVSLTNYFGTIRNEYGHFVCDTNRLILGSGTIVMSDIEDADKIEISISPQGWIDILAHARGNQILITIPPSTKGGTSC